MDARSGGRRRVTFDLLKVLPIKANPTHRALALQRSDDPEVPLNARMETRCSAVWPGGLHEDSIIIIIINAMKRRAHWRNREGIHKTVSVCLPSFL